MNNYFDFINSLCTMPNCPTLSSVLDVYKFYQNIRALELNLLDFSRSFYSLFFYDIIILTETWISFDFNNFELVLINYRFLKLDRIPNNKDYLRDGVFITVKIVFKSYLVILNI